MEADNAGEVRIQKIARIIRECRHGIHDLSRTEIDPNISLPRFNMPLELGMFLGAQMIGAGKQKSKNCLVLDLEKYRYRNFCSDISGQDIKAHDGDPARALEAVRNWLGTFSVAHGMGTMPGPKKMREDTQSSSLSFRPSAPACIWSLTHWGSSSCAPWCRNGWL